MFASPSPHVRRANHLEHATRCCIRPRDCRHRDAALRYRAPTSRICIAATAAGMVPRSGAAVLAHVSGQLGHACRRCSRPRVPLDTRNSCRRASRHAAVAQLAFGVLLPRTSTARRCLHAPAVRRRAREPGRLRLLAICGAACRSHFGASPWLLAPTSVVASCFGAAGFLFTFMRSDLRRRRTVSDFAKSLEPCATQSGGSRAAKAGNDGWFRNRYVRLGHEHECQRLRFSSHGRRCSCRRRWLASGSGPHAARRRLALGELTRDRARSA